MAAVGWVGLGKLGGPCSAALQHYGSHTVYGYDPYVTHVNLADLPSIRRVDSIAEVVQKSDNVVYVAVQTPHHERFGGETLLPEDEDPEDFEYGYLINAVRDVARAALELRKVTTIVVVSTVLPGTTDRYLRPLLNEFTDLVYHPFFIAMGTVVDDFINPEFALLGSDHPANSLAVSDLYEHIHSAPNVRVSIASAELTKVAYNTFISTKIVFANTLMMMCDTTGADVDEVTDTLALATDRVISPRYMRAGMGDGGACHPRDNIALSALARRHGIMDFMGMLNTAREIHTRWLANLAVRWVALAGYKPLVVLGKSYKPGIDMIAGSPALLLANILRDFKIPFTQVDPYVDSEDTCKRALLHAAVYVIATRHDEFTEVNFPDGSVVIDPFGYIPANSSITLVTPGRKSR